MIIDERAQDGLMGLAASLCLKAGVDRPLALVPLAGGRNNRVVRLELAGGEQVLMKCYHHDPRDPRDRLSAEWDFLSYAAERRLPQVPRPLALDTQAHAALYSFAAGQKLAPGSVNADHVARALAFVHCLNAPPREPNRLRPGSEACFSVADHLMTVDQRIARLHDIAPDSKLHVEAHAFMRDRVSPEWVKIKSSIQHRARQMGLELNEPLASDALCVSPSDFGFHNALVDEDGHVTFIDFEYAGRDDPAKLVCDFFCQPEVPVPLAYFDDFTSRVIGELGAPDQHCDRTHLLFDAYRIKWLCIMLNEFLPQEAARRAFAGSSVHTEQCQMQLDKATAVLSSIGRS